jgi:hypothetical protein
MRLVRSSLLKLALRPATRLTPLVIAALIAVLYLSFAFAARASADAGSGLDSMLGFPGAHLSLAGMLMMLGGLAGAGYGGAVAASEWSWSTFRAALVRGESRVGYIVGLFSAIALLALAAWLALYVLGVGLILLAGAIAGLPPGDPLGAAYSAKVLLLVACGGWAMLMQVAIGFGVGFVSRSAVAGVTAMAGLLLIEQMAGMIVPADFMRLAPLSASASLVNVAGSAGLDAALGIPLIVTTVYLSLGVAVAALVARRSEVA